MHVHYPDGYFIFYPEEGPNVVVFFFPSIFIITMSLGIYPH